MRWAERIRPACLSRRERHRAELPPSERDVTRATCDVGKEPRMSKMNQAASVAGASCRGYLSNPLCRDRNGHLIATQS